MKCATFEVYGMLSKFGRLSDVRCVVFLDMLHTLSVYGKVTACVPSVFFVCFYIVLWFSRVLEGERLDCK